MWKAVECTGPLFQLSTSRNSCCGQADKSTGLVHGRLIFIFLQFLFSNEKSGRDENSHQLGVRKQNTYHAMKSSVGLKLYRSLHTYVERCLSMLFIETKSVNFGPDCLCSNVSF